MTKDQHTQLLTMLLLGLSDLPEQSNEPISIPSPPPTTSTTSTSKVRSRSASTSYGNNGTTVQGQDIKKALYKDAVECPICFLVWLCRDCNILNKVIMPCGSYAMYV